MPQFDQEKMIKLVSELRKSVARLRELSKLPKDQFLGDPDKIGSTKYHFIVAIEASIDICNHLISRNGFGYPKTMETQFKKLFLKILFISKLNPAIDCFITL